MIAVLYLIAQYWPFVVIALVLGVATGWLVRAPAGGQPMPDPEDFET